MEANVLAQVFLPSVHAALVTVDRIVVLVLLVMFQLVHLVLQILATADLAQMEVNVSVQAALPFAHAALVTVDQLVILVLLVIF